MKQLLEPLLNLVFPPRCEVCKTSSREPLCYNCFQQIKFMKPHLGINSVSVYDGPLREAIHRFKFNKRKKLADPLGVLMVQYLSSAPGIDMRRIDAIVPVPLHEKRRRERGFNQAELLAGVIGRYFGKPVSSALIRVRDTHAQFDLPGPQRFDNIKQAFAVAEPGAVFNQRILLVDDIYTTGSTIAECSRALQSAGARRIEVVTLSRAVDPVPSSVQG